MKNISKNALFAVIIGFGILSFGACRKPCKDVICENNGVEREDGKECVCDCVTGYEGELCDLELRREFLEIWEGQDVCGPETKKYYLQITRGNNVNEVTITNISDFGHTHNVIATVTDSANFAFENASTGGKVFNGTGKLSDGKLMLDYTMTQNAVSITCSGTFEVYVQ